MEWKNENASERETKQSRKREGSIVEDTRIKKRYGVKRMIREKGKRQKKMQRLE